MDYHFKIASAITLTGLLLAVVDANGISNKIFKGRKARTNELLFVTWIEHQGDLVCSGSLVGEEWVLTVARCVYNTSLADYRIAVGDVIVTNKNDGQQFFPPDSFYLHPDYNNATRENDIALIRLPEALDTSIETLDLVPSLMSDSLDDIINNKDTCTLSGFGETDVGTPASRKMKLNIRIAKDRVCEDINAEYDETDQLCVQPKQKKSKACKGDEGGPVVCTVNGTLTQVGIVWDTDCSNTITAATKMSAYLSWTQEIIANYSYERCPNLPTVSDGTFVPDGPTVVNSTAQLQCDDGFFPTSTDDTVTCQSGGTYTANNISCGCDNPPSISDGNYTTNGTNAIGDVAVLTCNYGYESSTSVLSEKTITCEDTGSWSSSSASCVIMCEPPTAIANGTFDPDVSFYSSGDSTMLVCDEGFVRSVKTDDKATITCRSNGKWTNNNAECQRSCGSLPAAANGTFETDSKDMLVGDTAVLTCDSDFLRSTENVSQATITCQSSGNWSSTNASCLQSCGVPGAVENGTLGNNGTNFGDIAILTCESGYAPSTTDVSELTITCEPTGDWSTLTASCIRTCGNLSTPLNGTFTPNSGLLVNDTAVLACDSEFVRSTSNDSEATISCGNDGTWTTTSAYCIRTCGNLSTPLNGTFTPNSGLLVNDTAVLACDSEFVRSTSNDSEATISCGNDGTWTTTPAYCIRTCGNLSTPLNGTFTPNSGLLVNDTAVLACDSEFVRSTSNDSEATISCGNDGTWTTTPAYCIRTCGNLSTPLNGTFTPNSGLLVNDTAVLACDSEFVRSTSNDSEATISCGKNGAWTTTPAYCIRTCGNLSTPLNGTFTPNSGLLVNDTAVLACDSEFVRSTSNDSEATISCGNDGTWTTTPAYCIRSCGDPPSAVNGTFVSNSSDFIVNDTAVLTCDTDYVRSTSVDSEATTTCGNDGQWTSIGASCIRSCGMPSSALNGTFVSNSSDLIVNDTAVLACDSDYVRSTSVDSDATISCESDGQWTSTSAYCIRSCGMVTFAENGTFISNSSDLIVNDTATLACDSDYVRSTTLDSEATITCESDGQWTSTDAYCIRSCGTPPSAMNGTFISNSTDFIVNDTAALTCDSDYVRSTAVDLEATVSCESDGQWTSTAAYCIRSCGMPPSALNGTFVSNSSDFIVNDTAVLACDSDYVRSTTVDLEATISCGSNGQWTPTAAYCIRSCGMLPSPLNGTFVSNSSDLIVNDTAVLACDSDYVRSTSVDSDATISCESDGQWTSTAAYCIRSCGMPPIAVNGTFVSNSSDLIVNDTATLACDSDYVRSTILDSEATITCGSDGQWNSTDAYCIRSCGAPPSALNGTFVSNSTDFIVNDTAVLSCDSDYVRSASVDLEATVSCGSDGQWTSTAAYCIRSCGMPPSALNGTFVSNSSDFIVNDTAVLACDSDYVRSTTVDSEATISCGSNGQWTATAAYCIRSCGVLPFALNGTFVSNSTDLIVNDTAVLACDSDYVRSTSVDSNATISCESDGQWTPTAAICIRSCGTLPLISNGTFVSNSSDLIVNDTATITCDSQFLRSTPVDSEATITCEEDGQWSPTAANCIRQCGEPPLAVNGTFVSNSSDFIVNDTAVLACDSDYVRSTTVDSDATITCENDGQWTSTAAYCIRSCGVPPSALNGSFVSNSSDFIVNDTAVLACDDGYVRSTAVDSEATITCESDGQWTSTASYCIRSCGTPPLATYGAFGVNKTYIVNDTLELVCDTNYTRSTAFVAEASITCQENGNWSASSAYCVASCQSSGTSFMMGFFKNIYAEGNAILYGTVSEPLDMTVKIPHYDYEQTVYVPQYVTISLPNPLGGENNEVSNKAIQVTTDKPMTIFLYHTRDSSAEGTVVFPEECGSKEYILVTHDASALSDIAPSESVTVAMVDNTAVTIVEHLSGVTKTAVLNQYDILHHSASDLSGTTITASENVHVFAGHRCANVPDTSVGRCDYLIEQMPPISSLRKAYLLTYQKPRPHYSVRIVAPYNSTDVTFWAANGTLLNTVQLDQMESYFETFLNSDSISITANNDILVAQYAHGLESDNSDVGDPSYVVIPSLTQFATTYSTLLNPTLFSNNYITIIINNDDDMSGLRVNDVALTSLTYQSVYVPGVGNFNVLHEELTGESTKVTVTHVNGTVEFGAVQYGFSSRLGYALIPGRNIPAYF